MQAFGEAVPETSRVAHRHEQEAEALKHIRGAYVLLVEDNEINQQVAREILEGAGLIVALATNGQEAVNAVKNNEYDAVLMDIQMPVMDGYTATRKIREWESGIRKSECGMRKSEDRSGNEERGSGNGETEDRRQMTDDRSQKKEDQQPAVHREPNAVSLPIIAMTAHAMAGDEEKSLQAGMNGHVTKPIDPDQLFATLQKWIKPSDKRDPRQPPEIFVEGSEADQALSQEEALPESLPGFDLAAGLKRLRGNKRLYRKLLRDFGTDYTGVAGDVRQALDAKDFEHAHRLVHNLKGLAGNLAATALQAASVNLEKLVKGVQQKTPPAGELNLKMSQLENALQHTLESVHSLGVSAEENTCKFSDEEIAAIPAEFAGDIAKQIRDAAELGDVTTLTAIAEEIKARSASCEPLSKQIILLAEDFDLDGIQKLAELLDTC
jgi:CheY-like chemotaxis protein